MLASAVLVSAVLAGCDSVSAECKNGTCHLLVKGDDTITLGGHSVHIGHISDHTVTITDTGAEFVLREGETVSVAGKTLRLSRIEGGSVSLDVDPAG
ncbi:hypothetical protein [Actinokineospora enzanensis]|uniref:hypothetical protein n=1 Tax=Actinokineospora enzanensis TaxID=155975 RepID=UPI0003604D92|nr:hypothetical protein [Actinokineospora enzanensis]